MTSLHVFLIIILCGVFKREVLCENFNYNVQNEVEGLGEEYPRFISGSVSFQNGTGNKVLKWVYGMNFMREEQMSYFQTLDRFGGESTSRYNIFNDYSNRNIHWFFMNLKGAHPSGELRPLSKDPNETTLEVTIKNSIKRGGKVIVTVPLMGYISPKVERGIRCSFPSSSFSNISMTEYEPFCNPKVQSCCSSGQILNENGETVKIDPGDIEDVSDHFTSSDVVAFFSSLRNKLGRHNFDKTVIFGLENEPFLFIENHADILNGLRKDGSLYFDENGFATGEISYEYVWNKTVEYGSIFKSVFPKVKILGPNLWGWCSIMGRNSLEHNGCFSGIGRRKNGDFLEWYIKKIYEYKEVYGIQLVDIISFHYYPTRSNLGRFGESSLEIKSQFRSLRNLFDTNYTDETWINEKMYLIPRVKNYIKNAGFGEDELEVAISEYNFQGSSSVSWPGEGNKVVDSVVLGELLSLLSREGVRYATRWLSPNIQSSEEFVFRMYLDFDGEGNVVEGYSIGITTNMSQEYISTYSTYNDSTGLLFITIITKDSENVYYNDNMKNMFVSFTVDDWIAACKTSNFFNQQNNICLPHIRINRFSSQERVIGDVEEYSDLLSSGIVNVTLRPFELVMVILYPSLRSIENSQNGTITKEDNYYEDYLDIVEDVENQFKERLSLFSEKLRFKLLIFSVVISVLFIILINYFEFKHAIGSSTFIKSLLGSKEENEEAERSVSSVSRSKKKNDLISETEEDIVSVFWKLQEHDEQSLEQAKCQKVFNSFILYRLLVISYILMIVWYLHFRSQMLSSVSHFVFFVLECILALMTLLNGLIRFMRPWGPNEIEKELKLNCNSNNKNIKNNSNQEESKENKSNGKSEVELTEAVDKPFQSNCAIRKILNEYNSVKMYRFHVLMPCYKEQNDLISWSLECIEKMEIPEEIQNVYLMLRKPIPPLNIYLLDDSEDIEINKEREQLCNRFNNKISNKSAISEDDIKKNESDFDINTMPFEEESKEIYSSIPMIRFTYIKRKKGTPNHAKAGNINWAIQNVIIPNLEAESVNDEDNKNDDLETELFVVFDCDHKPKSSFLKKLLPYFVENNDIALVQTPQTFLNDGAEADADIYNHSNFSYFYCIMPALGYWNAVMVSGTNFIVRGRALKEIGFVPVDSITEDALLGLKLISNGWKIKYHSEYLAVGECPENYSDFVKQRSRWIKGNLQILFKHNPCKLSLNFMQRLLFFYNLSAPIINSLLFFLLMTALFLSSKPWIQLMDLDSLITYSDVFEFVIITIIQVSLAFLINNYHPLMISKASLIWSTQKVNSILLWTSLKAIVNTIKEEFGFKTLQFLPTPKRRRRKRLGSLRISASASRSNSGDGGSEKSLRIFQPSSSSIGKSVTDTPDDLKSIGFYNELIFNLSILAVFVTSCGFLIYDIFYLHFSQTMEFIDFLRFIRYNSIDSMVQSNEYCFRTEGLINEESHLTQTQSVKFTFFRLCVLFWSLFMGLPFLMGLKLLLSGNDDTSHTMKNKRRLMFIFRSISSFIFSISFFVLLMAILSHLFTPHLPQLNDEELQKDIEKGVFLKKEENFEHLHKEFNYLGNQNWSIKPENYSGSFSIPLSESTKWFSMNLDPKEDLNMQLQILKSNSIARRESICAAKKYAFEKFVMNQLLVIVLSSSKRSYNISFEGNEYSALFENIKHFESALPTALTNSIQLKVNDSNSGISNIALYRTDKVIVVEPLSLSIYPDIVSLRNSSCFDCKENVIINVMKLKALNETLFTLRHSKVFKNSLFYIAIRDVFDFYLFETMNNNNGNNSETNSTNPQFNQLFRSVANVTLQLMNEHNMYSNGLNKDIEPHVKSTLSNSGVPLENGLRGVILNAMGYVNDSICLNMVSDFIKVFELEVNSSRSKIECGSAQSDNSSTNPLVSCNNLIPHFLIDSSRNGGEFSDRPLDDIRACGKDPPYVLPGKGTRWSTVEERTEHNENNSSYPLGYLQYFDGYLQLVEIGRADGRLYSEGLFESKLVYHKTECP